MKVPIFVSLIAYVHNDASCAGRFIAEYDAYLSGRFDCYEIIIVNDGSTDVTAAEVDLAVKDAKGNVILINLPWKHGVEPAMTAGLHKSVGDFVYEIDSINTDFSPDILMTLYETASNGCDVVSASSEWERPLSSRLFYKFINRVSYVNLNLASETIRLSSRRALNAMLTLKEKFRYRKALYLLTGYPSRRITYRSSAGASSRRRSRADDLSLAVDVIIGFSNIGIKTIHFLSTALFVFSVFIAGYTVYQYIFNQSLVRGWPTIMLFLSIVFSGLFFILGILGEYILRILAEVKGRPYYTVSSVKVYPPSGRGGA
ncbi:MAG: glycosyltransferase [Deltaproteobacteria bacterium]|nr:glycosyltransferase [Deltaproteobacteria bacterium]